MWYKYVACNSRGQTAAGVMEAPSEREAEKTLWRSDLTIISLSQQRKPVSAEDLLPTLYRVKPGDVIYFARDLATLLESGIGILAALKMLHGRAIAKPMKKVLTDVKSAVETGSSFSDACGRHPEAFSPFFIRMVKVGEEVGNLEVLLRQISLQMEKDEQVKKKVRSAMVYPSFVLIVASLAIFALLYFVVPAMQVLFSQIGGQLPLITVIVLTVATFLKDNVLIILLVLVVVAVFSTWYRKTDTGKRTLGKLVLKIPIIGRVVLLGTMTQMARNTAIMIRGGISLVDGLDLLVQTTSNYPLRRALEKIRHKVLGGESLSTAIGKQKIFPALFSQVVGVGEASGRLESNLEVLADFYEVENDRAVSKATGLLSPILVAGCGAIVGLIALAIYTPIYSLMGQLS